jgi:hypothetical protein
MTPYLCAAPAWTRLGWVLQGHADILTDGSEHARAQDLLRGRYAQLRVMNMEALPVIAVCASSAC